MVIGIFVIRGIGVRVHGRWGLCDTWDWSKDHGGWWPPAGVEAFSFHGRIAHWFSAVWQHGGVPIWGKANGFLPPKKDHGIASDLRT